CHAMNPYWLIEFYSISGLIPIPDFMKPASAGRFSLKCGSYLFIQATPPCVPFGTRRFNQLNK
ncbi:hypothetical protein, partial [Hornefia butyriciproducens]|uniref:hypothetical protein n=1 Tax=Hornefia butyriciproducens TaxID=2652293 RepID=UPI003F8BCC87